MPRSEIGEGVFLNIAPEEKDAFWSIITGAGYPADAEGVKSYILEGELEPVNGTTRVLQMLEENPELVHFIKHAGSRIIKNVVKGLRL